MATTQAIRRRQAVVTVQIMTGEKSILDLSTA